MKFIREHWVLLALFCITLFGFLLRLHNLDWQCLKIDELVTQWAALQPTADIIKWSLSVDYNPPLYYLLAHWSSMLFGEASKFALRFPALILGTLSIPAAYFVGKEFNGKTLGILVASLLSFMFPFFYYSQDARAYPLVLFAFLCFTFFYVKMYKGDTGYKTIFCLGFFAALCFWSHYYSLVPVGMLILTLLWKRRIAILYSSVVAFVLTLPMIILFDLNQLATRTNHGIFNVYWTTPFQMAIELPNEIMCWSWIIIIPLVAYALIKCSNPLLKIFTVVGFVTSALLIPLAQITAIMPRYAILISPLFLLVAMYPITEIIDGQKQIDRKVAIYSMVVFGVFLLNFQSLIMWNTFDTCPFV